jgi:hypothetical protein
MVAEHFTAATVPRPFYNTPAPRHRLFAKGSEQCRTCGCEKLSSNRERFECISFDRDRSRGNRNRHHAVCRLDGAVSISQGGKHQLVNFEAVHCHTETENVDNGIERPYFMEMNIVL